VVDGALVELVVAIHLDDDGFRGYCSRWDGRELLPGGHGGGRIQDLARRERQRASVGMGTEQDDPSAYVYSVFCVLIYFNFMYFF
jgi:hypothetical protein